MSAECRSKRRLRRVFFVLRRYCLQYRSLDLFTCPAVPSCDLHRSLRVFPGLKCAFAEGDTPNLLCLSCGWFPVASSNGNLGGIVFFGLWYFPCPAVRFQHSVIRSFGRLCLLAGRLVGLLVDLASFLSARGEEQREGKEWQEWERAHFFVESFAAGRERYL